jgi:hypothetical protein
MKYGDDLDRISDPGVSRRQFLGAGGGRAARLVAAVLFPGRLRRAEETSEQHEERSDRRIE